MEVKTIELGEVCKNIVYIAIDDELYINETNLKEGE